jgi:hypothetical protein
VPPGFYIAVLEQRPTAEAVHDVRAVLRAQIVVGRTA